MTHTYGFIHRKEIKFDLVTSDWVINVRFFVIVMAINLLFKIKYFFESKTLIFVSGNSSKKFPKKLKHGSWYPNDRFVDTRNES